jgi:hypothetical protein
MKQVASEFHVLQGSLLHISTFSKSKQQQPFPVIQREICNTIPHLIKD